MKIKMVMLKGLRRIEIKGIKDQEDMLFYVMDAYFTSKTKIISTLYLKLMTIIHSI
jgi:hypothetical protein